MAAVPTVELPAGATPFLLVMPATAGADLNTAVSIEGQQAWAIPVSIPAGTRGYAVFVPLVPTAPSAGQVVEVGTPSNGAEVPDAPGAGATGGGVSALAMSPADAIRFEVAQGAASVDPGPTEVAEDTEASAPDASPHVHGAVAPQPVAFEAQSEREDATTHPALPEPVAAGTTPAPVAVARIDPLARFLDLAAQQPVYGTSFLSRIWPAPAAARGWAVPISTLVGGLALAIFVPLGRTGIGWFLGGLVLTAAVMLAVWRRTSAEPRSERLMRLTWAVSALALLSVLAFRNAWWLVTFCVLGALGCAALAIVGGRLVRSILFSVVAAPFAALRGIPWVARHLEGRRKDGTPSGTVRRVVWSIIVTVILLLIFGSLLSSADAAFSQVLTDLVPRVNEDSFFGWVFLFIVGALIAVAAVYTISAAPDLSDMDNGSQRKVGLVEWALPIGALVLLFAGFVAVQFTVLFGGQRHVLQTAGLNYADYARSGFWQLAAVTVLTLAVLAGVTRWARREQPADHTVLRILLGLLCALSVVIVVSALYRMYTYQKIYSFTGERIFVMAFELLLGTVFIMIMAAGIRWRGVWIPRLTIGLAVVMLLSLAVLNPEDYAARRNIQRYHETGKIDAWYLRALSADATPALTNLPDEIRRCTLSWIADDLREGDPWYAWNLGRVEAREALDALGKGAVGGPTDCRAADQFDLPKTR